MSGSGGRSSGADSRGAPSRGQAGRHRLPSPGCGRATSSTTATRRSSRGSSRPSPSSTSTRSRSTPPRCWSGPPASRSGSPRKSVRCRDVLSRILALDGASRASSASPLPETLMLARAGLPRPRARLPDRRPARDLGAAPRSPPSDPGRAPVADGRRRRAARPDRGGGGRRRRARSGSRSTSTLGCRALRGAVQVGPKRSPIRTPAGRSRSRAEIDRRDRAQARRADGLRGPDRRRRRRDPGKALQEPRDPPDAGAPRSRSSRERRADDRRRGLARWRRCGSSTAAAPAASS